MNYKHKILSEIKSNKIYSDMKKKNNINLYSPSLRLKTKNLFSKKNKNAKSLFLSDYIKNDQTNNKNSFFYTNSNFNEYLEGSKFTYSIRKKIHSTKMNTNSEINSFHSNLLKEKLFQFKRNNFNRTMNNFSQNKKYNFITSLEDAENNEESINKLNISNKICLNQEYDTKIQNNKKENTKNYMKVKNPLFINNRSLHYLPNKVTKNHYFNTVKDLNNKNKIFSKKNFTFSKDNLDLKNISAIQKPVIKFNNTLNEYFLNLLKNNEIETNKESINSLIKHVNTKFKYTIIKQVHTEKLLRLQEEKEQLNIISHQANIYKIIEKYFYSLSDSLRRYVMYLFGQINEENKKLNCLRQGKDKLLKEINELTKNINNLTKEKKLLTNIKQFCLMVKIGKNSLKNLPDSEYEKYGIMKKNKKSKFISKNNLKGVKYKKGKRESFTKLPSTINIVKDDINYRRAKTPKLKAANYSILEKNGRLSISSQKKPTRNSKKRKTISISFRKIKKIGKQQDIKIFNNTEEFIKRFHEIENKIKNEFKLYNKISEQNLKIKKEKTELESYYEKFMSVDYDYEEKLYCELEKEKTKNKQLNLKKNILFFECYDRYPNSNNSYEKSFEVLNKNNCKNIKNNVKNNNIIRREKGDLINNKIKEILLNFNTEIQKFLGSSKFYENINNNDRKYINYNGCQYRKEIYMLKILEKFYLKLVQWKKDCMENFESKKEYRQIKHQREKLTNIRKVKQKKFEEDLKRLKTMKKVISRTNKIIILPLKKIDPFQKKILEDNEITKRKYKKRGKTVNTYQEYEGFISYE